MDALWQLVAEACPGFREDMQEIEGLLLQSIPEATPTELYSASRHLILTGGKRIRPALVLLAYRAVEPEGEVSNIAGIAVGIELIHTATIIHDDIIDLATMRRGVETVNARWGNDIAILAGDLIFSRAFGYIGTHPVRRVSEVVSGACMRLAEGEVLETLHTGNASLTEEVYLEIVERKTASLFQASAECGALAGGAGEEATSALARFGYLLGIGFQMTDDLLDLVGGESVLGKKVGMDISLGKPTFVILHALRSAPERERQELEEILRKGQKSSKDVERALEILEKAGSIEYAGKRARHFVERAKKQLTSLPVTPARRALEVIADYAIKREF
ncbi:polyprenyl synthetase family protein [Candidatus Pyrohabitans sp.]